MANYGMKTSKKGVSALDATAANLLMSTHYPFTKIDPTMLNTFRTTNVTFLNDAPDNTKTQIASFAHGYTYRPQVWGLWNVTWGPNIAGTPNVVQNGYGTLLNTSGVPASTLSYEWDATNVYLYITKGAIPPGAPSNTIGTSVRLTTYVFADDMQDQDYTS